MRAGMDGIARKSINAHDLAAGGASWGDQEISRFKSSSRALRAKFTSRFLNLISTVWTVKTPRTISWIKSQHDGHRQQAAKGKANRRAQKKKTNTYY